MFEKNLEKEFCVGQEVDEDNPEGFLCLIKRIFPKEKAPKCNYGFEDIVEEKGRLCINGCKYFNPTSEIKDYFFKNS